MARVCPFCWENSTDTFASEEGVYVGCLNCGARGPISDRMVGEGGARKRWEGAGEYGLNQMDFHMDRIIDKYGPKGFTRIIKKDCNG